MNSRTPLEQLASLSVREAFGEGVGRVSDALQGRGDLTLREISAFLRRGEEDGQEDRRGDDGNGHRSGRGRRSSFCHPDDPEGLLGVRSASDRSFVRAAVVVLMQHGVVSAVPAAVSGPAASEKRRKPATAAAAAATRPPELAYRFHREAACRLSRHAKWVELCRRAVLAGDDVAAAAVQCLLLSGRLRTVDWISGVVEARERAGAPVDPRYTAREQAVEAAHQLQAQGFVVEVAPAFGSAGEDGEEDESDEEHEFEEEPPPGKKRRRSRTGSAADHGNGDGANPPTAADDADANAGSERNGGGDGEDPVILAILGGSAHYKGSLLPSTKVWRVSTEMFGAYQRAYQYGRLVAERYGHRVQGCGSLVTAALKHLAQQARHGPPPVPGAAAGSPWTPSFAPSDLIRHVPKPVLQILEKKPGGLHHNLSKAFEDLLRVARAPPVVAVQEAVSAAAAAAAAASASGVASPGGAPAARYRICAGAISGYVRERIAHQLVSDRHGAVAGRTVSLLGRAGYLEAEAVADRAMVPVREAREILHCLYRSGYVDVIAVTAAGGGSGGGAVGGGAGSGARPAGGAAGAPSAAPISSYHSGTVYLWGVRRARLRRQVLDDVAKALVNIRLRRGHELEVGREWIERAKQAPDTDENDHEADRESYTRFCLGLDRLDAAALQLDDTLLALTDFR